MRAQISVHLAVLVLVAGAGRAGATDPPPLAQPKQPQYEFKRATFRGVIKRLDEKSLDLDGVGGLPTSRVDVTGVWRFSPTPILALGAQRKDVPQGGCYRWSDLKVGDHIWIFFDRAEGVNLCTMIVIERRPGGQVPPSPHPGEPVDRQYHEWRNAYNDWVDHGIPIPDHLRPAWERGRPPEPRPIPQAAP